MQPYINHTPTLSQVCPEPCPVLQPCPNLAPTLSQWITWWIIRFSVHKFTRPISFPRDSR